MIWLVALLTAAPAPASEPAATRIIDWRDCGLAAPTDTIDPTLRDCVANAGRTASQTIALRLGGSFDTLAATSVTAQTVPLSSAAGAFTYVVDVPTTLVWTIGDDRFDFRDVGGGGNAVLAIERAIDADVITGFRFAWQNRPLSLDEGLARARAFEAALVGAGFRPAADQRAFAAFTADEAPIAHRAADWADARALLAADRDGVVRMTLTRLRRDGVDVRVEIFNSRRDALAFDKDLPAAAPRYDRTVFDGNGGFEWQLEVTIGHPERDR